MPQDDERPADPFAVLGLPPGADEDQVRTRYLQLIKEHPPESDPEKFRQVQQAYQDARDPLRVADLLLERYIDDPRPWREIIEHHRDRPPRLSTDLLLSLGNEVKPGRS